MIKTIVKIETTKNMKIKPIKFWKARASSKKKYSLKFWECLAVRPKCCFPKI